MGDSGITAQMASAGISARNGARVRRNYNFLEQQLEHVREGLRRSRNEQQIDAVRPAPGLNPADDFTFGQRVVRHDQNEANDDHQSLHGNQQGRRPVGRNQARQEIAYWAPLPHG